MITTIRPGDQVTVEHTTGQSIGRPSTRTVSGRVYLDDEGTPRVEGVPLWQDADGYFPEGVVIISVNR